MKATVHPGTSRPRHIHNLSFFFRLDAYKGFAETNAILHDLVMATVQNQEALEIRQAELRLAEIRAELRLNELKLKRDTRIPEREIFLDEPASDSGISHEVVAGSRIQAEPPSSKARNRTTMKVPRKMKRKAEDSIPGDHRICFQLENMPSVPAHANSSKKIRKRNPAACSECRRKHLQCSHELRGLPAHRSKPSDLDIFAMPLTIEVLRRTEGQQQLEYLTYNASTFPLIDGDLRLLHERSGLAWHLSGVGVAQSSAGNSGSALLWALNALSDTEHLDAIIRAGMCTRYIEALDWVVWLCSYVIAEHKGKTTNELSSHSLLSESLAGLRHRVLSTSGKYSLPHSDGGPGIESKLLPDTHLAAVALKARSCAGLDRIAEVYLRTFAQHESSKVGQWWREIFRHIDHDASIILEAIEALPDARIQSKVWQMALDGASNFESMELCQALLGYGWSLAGQSTDHGRVFASLLSDYQTPPATDSLDWSAPRLVRGAYATNGGRHEPNCLVYDEDEDTKSSPLQVASRSGCEALVRSLLRLGASPDGLPHEAGFPLGAAARRGYCSIIRVLCDADADVNAKDERRQETALMIACESGQLGAATILLDAGANLRAEIAFRETSLYMAAYNGHSDVVDLLISAGTNVAAYHHSALLRAAECHAETAFKLLLAKGAVLSGTESTKRWNRTIAIAAFDGRVSMVELLLVAFEGGLLKSPCPEDGLARSLLRESGTLRQWIQNEAQMDLTEDLRQTRDEMRALQLLLEHGIWVYGYSTMKEGILNSIAHLEILNEMDLHLARRSAKDVQSQSFPWTAEEMTGIPRRLYECTPGPSSPDSDTYGSVTHR
ncbi:unnamed protein product [Zymoseptoria tritici ST99CH_3D1]|nr:unnamed protein product [Zymoseptoria tritici ST99CH_3D1]